MLVNEGYLSIYSVEFGCRPNLFRFSNGIVMDGGGLVTHRHPAMPEIQPTEKETLDCQPLNMLQAEAPLEKADLGISVTFRPSFWPWKVTEEYRFITVRGHDGKLHWTPVSVGTSLENRR